MERLCESFFIFHPSFRVALVSEKKATALFFLGVSGGNVFDTRQLLCLIRCGNDVGLQTFYPGRSLNKYALVDYIAFVSRVSDRQAKFRGFNNDRTIPVFRTLVPHLSRSTFDFITINALSVLFTFKHFTEHLHNSELMF
jgi:hypothetical protein